jgi:XRE family transcriptional regulator, regulator of sulfur utilization
MATLDLAGRLKKLRKERGWSQQRLAEAAGVSYMVITRIEQGLSKEPTILSMVSLADALGVTLDELVGRVPPRPSKK